MSALICAWMRVDLSDQADFLDFHTREHLPERLAIPGFQRGRRFQSITTPQTLLMLYDVESLAVLTSAAYVERLNHPTDWTKRCMPLIRESRCLAIELDWESEKTESEVIGVVHFDIRHTADLPTLMSLASQVARLPGVTAFHRGRVDLAASNLDTAERRALGAGAHTHGFVILLEAIDEDTARHAFAMLNSAHEAIPADVELYRLQLSRSA